jgi:hypothetical protein
MRREIARIADLRTAVSPFALGPHPFELASAEQEVP